MISTMFQNSFQIFVANRGHTVLPRAALFLETMLGVLLSETLACGEIWLTSFRPPFIKKFRHGNTMLEAERGCDSKVASRN